MAERKNLISYIGAPVGGRASKISFARDELGRLEVMIVDGSTISVSVLSNDDTVDAAKRLFDEFGKAAQPKPPAK